MGNLLTNLCVTSRCTVILEDLTERLEHIEKINTAQDEQLKMLQKQLDKIECCLFESEK